jgi:GNAT superfamily N-acetyltransferase
MEIDVYPVTAKRWADLEAFFGPSGGYANCWCVWWRVPAKTYTQGVEQHGAPNRELLHRLTVQGRVPGLLAYSGGDPVGWVSLGPRPDFGRLARSPKLRPAGRPDDDPDDPNVWSVVCFWIPRRHRGKGVATRLLDAAITRASRRGAAALEGYPIDTSGARRASAELFTGTIAMFEKAGFQEVRRVGGRPVVRLDLT